MSANERRVRGIKESKRKEQSQRSQRGIRSNLPRTNIASSVTRSQNRIRNIKSPFASDQTKTIGNRPSQSKKRTIGQIPLRDRQHSKLKVNQQAGSGIGQQVRKLAQTKQRSGLGQQVRKLAQKKQTKKPTKPTQFNRKNKPRKDIEQVFNFDANRSFF